MATLRGKAALVQIDQVYSLWTVLGLPYRNDAGEVVCLCRCRCGTEKPVKVGHLVSLRSNGCGCTRRQNMTASVRTHGEAGTKLYRVWKGMRERCTCEDHKSYHNYGGRGIRVCVAWQDDYAAFAAWARAAGYAEGLTIDREDTNGDYTPENCRVATNKENCNNKRNMKLVTVWGETKTIYEWSKDARCLVTDAMLRNRLKQGFDAEHAMTSPARLATAPITAWGETKRIGDWVHDPRCVVKETALYMRTQRYGWQPELAITTPAAPRTTS